MYTIGLVGGVASGKSTVAEMFSDLGAVVINADRLAHGVLATPKVLKQLVARWGEGILHEDGSVNRSAIARLVFSESADAEEERHFLESVIHPLTRKAVEEKRKRLAAEGQEVFVVDAPLLLEAGWDSACDTILMVDTPFEMRSTNAQRRGWDAEEIDRREEAQLPLDIKRHRSDVVIDNSGELSETREQVNIFWREVVAPQLGD